MTLHVTLLGIDGSGKSSLARALPRLLAAEHGLRAAVASDRFAVCDPDQDLQAPDFAPASVLWIVAVATWLKALTRRAMGHRLLYPLCKLLHMLAQDLAARRLAQRHRVDVMVSDCNALLSTAGRAANYLRPASQGSTDRAGVVDAAYLRRCYDFLQCRQRHPPSGPVAAGLAWMVRLASRGLRVLGLDLCWLPDLVVWLDVTPARALQRIDARGKARDAHENLADLAQARQMYATAIEALQQAADGPAVVVLHTDAQSPAQTLRALLQALASRTARAATRSPAPTARAPEPLGTSARTARMRAVLARLLSPRYHLYLLRHLLPHAWRELSFPLSSLGRQLLAEGYSASMMRAIYTSDVRRGLLDRIFLGYPLHRAVRDRLEILVPLLAGELRQRLAGPGALRVFTAPSGLADDLFGALEWLSDHGVSGLERVEIVAVDLDPAAQLAGALADRARALGVGLRFCRGDLGSTEVQTFIAAHAPYHLALFVGLSSWLPKPALVRHLSALAVQVVADGALISDCFTAAPYAIAGQLMGYRASYYDPRTYAAVLGACGWEHDEAAPRSGRDHINHVLRFVPRCAVPSARRDAQNLGMAA